MMREQEARKARTWNKMERDGGKSNWKIFNWSGLARSRFHEAKITELSGKK